MASSAIPMSSRANWQALGVDFDRLPNHIAIIMDGNGRWAKRKGHDRLIGHAKGYETLRDIVEVCGNVGIPYLTVYGFSSENWRRPENEVSGLMTLIERAMIEQMENLKRMNVQTRVIGRVHELPETLQKALSDGEASTSNCTGLRFRLAINYGGRAEILDAIERLRSVFPPDTPLTETDIAQFLYDPDAPECDLMIRTAGEMRWSNFLLWQAAYAELVVTDKDWPEFSGDDLCQAVLEFQRRTRKFGAVVDED